MPVIIGFILAGIMGIILGLIGGGGSILTLPILVYFFGLPVSLATAYSLFVVGLTSTMGTALAARRRTIDMHAAVIFAPISAVTVFVVRRFLLPSLATTFTFGTVHVSLDSILLILFATVMLASSISMIWYRNKEKPDDQDSALSYPHMIAVAVGVGLLTGVVGAGGGFLFVPSLVLFASLPMKRAIGTSLAIIAVNAFIGFFGDLMAGTNIDWHFLLYFSIAPVIGIILGDSLAAHISGPHLKKAFGWFVLFVGIAIMLDKLR